MPDGEAGLRLSGARSASRCRARRRARSIPLPDRRRPRGRPAHPGTRRAHGTAVVVAGGSASATPTTAERAGGQEEQNERSSSHALSVSRREPREDRGRGAVVPHQATIRQRMTGFAFREVPPEPDHVALEHRVLERWERERHVRAAARAERGRADVLVHRRADHREQPDGRAPRVGALAEGPVPALPRGARQGAALPERLRLPGALGRGRGREGARAQLEARDRGLRPRPLRARLPRPRRRVLRRADASSRAASACGWTGSGRTSR